jgi:flagellar hook-associated protein 3 FlgL
MRVSDSQRYGSFMRNIQDRLTNLTRIQQEMGTGQSIFTPSENVRKAGQALESQDQIASNTQYLRNIEDGKGWVSSADSQLQSISELLTQIDTLALAADNQNQNADDRRNSALEIDQKLEELAKMVNAKHGDRYLFGGFSTTNNPFTAERDANGRITGVTANQDTLAGKIYRRIGEGEDVQINIPGDKLFQPVGSAGTDQDVFAVIAQLRDTIQNNNTPPAGQEATQSTPVLRDKLAQSRERITSQQTYLGAIGQRLDQTTSRLKDRGIQLTDNLEQAQGVDMTDLVGRMTTEEGAYNALAGMASKYLNRSLVDYLG